MKWIDLRKTTFASCVFYRIKWINQYIYWHHAAVGIQILKEYSLNSILAASELLSHASGNRRAGTYCYFLHH